MRVKTIHSDGGLQERIKDNSGGRIDRMLGQVFSKNSVEDKRPVSQNGGILNDLEFPITCDDLIFATRRLRDAAPGHDRQKKHHIQGIKNTDFAVHMSLWLVC